MSKFYEKEGPRAEQARKDFGSYDLDFLAAAVGTFKTDGDLRWKEFCYAILEYKGEIGSTGAEPLFQAGWYYTAFTRDLLPGNVCSNLPCIILYAFGEFLGISSGTRAKISTKAPILALQGQFGQIHLICKC
jgi:hypothetical protein